MPTGVSNIESQPVEWRLKPDENNCGRKIEEYGNARLEPSRSLGLINSIINQ